MLDVLGKAKWWHWRICFGQPSECLTAGVLQRYSDSDAMQKCDNHFSNNTPKANNEQTAQCTLKKTKQALTYSRHQSSICVICLQTKHTLHTIVFYNLIIVLMIIHVLPIAVPYRHSVTNVCVCYLRLCNIRHDTWILHHDLYLCKSSLCPALPKRYCWSPHRLFLVPCDTDDVDSNRLPTSQQPQRSDQMKGMCKQGLSSCNRLIWPQALLLMRP